MATQGRKHRCWKIGIGSCLVIGSAIATTTQLKAQVTPNGTLGTRVSNSTSLLLNIFKDFSVPNGGTVFFDYDINIDSSRAFSNLSNAPLPELLGEGCRPNGKPAPRNKFYITGRGGLPPNPSERPGSGAVAEDLGSDQGKLISEAGKNQEIPSTLPAPDTQGGHPVTATTAPSTEVVEAQGWVRDANGDVYIVAQAPTVTPHSVGLQPVTCHEP